ncbi:MAG TPA: hypothetical protein DEO88_17025, partial [Syntrophobacteraceae bacterium]|nr:hypothetical protein [Syntrophobacteraceae bacterium]
AIARIGQAESGISSASRNRERYWLPDGLPRHVKYRTGQATVIIKSETKKVNVNKANHSTLVQVLQKAGVQEGEADHLADLIGDFIDADDSPRANGAEGSQYRRMGMEYTPFNGELKSLDQLVLVPGITSRLLYGEGSASHPDAEEGDSEELEQTGLPGFFSKNSLVELLTVYGNNVRLDAEKELVGPSGKSLTQHKWEAGGTYRILSYGECDTGPPGVLIWVIVRHQQTGKKGHEVLFRKIL